jgi:pimeloyl-ACP methyl ester carboxylesterase
VGLVNIFARQKGAPTMVYLIGASEGGIITALALEQYPDVFDGGLALCGPYGDFRKQIDYFGDFRVVFDYYFPDILPGSPITIPTTLMDDWDSYAMTVTRYHQSSQCASVTRCSASHTLRWILPCRSRKARSVPLWVFCGTTSSPPTTAS